MEGESHESSQAASTVDDGLDKQYVQYVGEKPIKLK
jgi:hypothetical protein